MKQTLLQPLIHLRQCNSVQLLTNKLVRMINRDSENEQFRKRKFLSSAKSRRNQFNTLRAAWNQNNISPHFQVIMEEYLLHFSDNELEELINHQEELVELNQSFLINLQSIEEQRNNSLEELKNKVTEFEDVGCKKQSHITELCALIRQLRMYSLIYAQNLINIHHYFKEKSTVPIKSNTMVSLFEALHQDNDFLAKSLLRKYIIFSKSYDPFLLKHFQLLKSTNNPRLKQLQAINSLFTIPISEVSRLAKAHQYIKQYLKRDDKELERYSTLNKETIRKSSVGELDRSPTNSIEYFRALEKTDNKAYLHPTRRKRISLHSEPSSQQTPGLRQDRKDLMMSERSEMTSEPKPEKMYFPRINSIRSNRQIEQEIANQRSTVLQQKNVAYSPIKRKKALDKTIEIVESNQQEFKTYIAGKRFSTAQKNGSVSPSFRIKNKDTFRKWKSPDNHSEQMTTEEQHPNTATIQLKKVSQDVDSPSQQLQTQRQSKIKQTAFSESQEPLTTSNKRSPLLLSAQRQKVSSSATRQQAALEQKQNEEKSRQKIFNRQSEPKEVHIQTQSSDTQPLKAQLQQQKQQQLPQSKPSLSKNKQVSSDSPSPKNKQSDKKFNTPSKEQQKPLSEREKRNQTALKPQQKKQESPAKQQQRQRAPSLEKIYKLCASEKQETADDIIKYIKECKIKSQYRSKFQINNWENSIRNNQYYLHKSCINNQVYALSLCCALPSGDIAIKYWAPFEVCDQEMSNFLFSKYIEYLQKSTRLKLVYYNAFPIDELPLNGFIKIKERIYQKERTATLSVEQHSYPHFLGINFINIAISKSVPDQEELIIQQEIEAFSTNTFVIFNYLLIINKLMQPGAFSAVAAYNPKLSSIQMAKQLILKNYLPDIAFNYYFKCDYCNLLTLKLRTCILSAFFLADKGFIGLRGQICYSDNESLIVYLPMHKYNTRLYFGRGIKNVSTMVQKVRKRSKENNEEAFFKIRMFKKTLRGKINSINLKEENCYGDLQISFLWKDYLKGKIAHSLPETKLVFDQQFYCLVEMEREVLFAFEVLPDNFVSETNI